MKKSVKSSEESKMVEAERPKCEKQVLNGSGIKRNTWRTTRLAKVAGKIQSEARMDLVKHRETLTLQIYGKRGGEPGSLGEVEK